MSSAVGGAVYITGNPGTQLQVAGCTFNNNSAGGGGAIAMQLNGTPNSIAIVNPTFSSNQAMGPALSGGAIHIRTTDFAGSTSLQVHTTFCTFYENSSINSVGKCAMIEAMATSGFATTAVFFGSCMVVDSVGGWRHCEYPCRRPGERRLYLNRIQPVPHDLVDVTIDRPDRRFVPASTIGRQWRPDRNPCD